MILIRLPGLSANETANSSQQALTCTVWPVDLVITGENVALPVALCGCFRVEHKKKGQEFGVLGSFTG